MTHVNKFVREIDKRETRLKVGRIYEYRIAGATDKSFKEVMRKMQQQERVIEARQAREEKRQMKEPMTFKERQALKMQGHVKFTDLPESEQKLRDEMWSQIPEHLREKANKMAGR